MNLERAKESLNKLLAMFESGDLPAAVARTMIKPVQGFERPCDSWSLGNKILMLLADTEDARGYKQWQQVGRQVKKGAKAIYILAPCTRTIKESIIDEKTGEERERKKIIITGFREIPVFRHEDTEGEPLPDANFDPPEPPPLQEVAKVFGVSEITYRPGNGSAYGFYAWGQERKRIVLHTHDIKTWFHELGHAIHNSFRQLKGGQNAEQEIVAELFSATMCELHGVEGYHSHAWQYIRHYSDEDPRQALRNIFRVLADVEECLKRVFDVTVSEKKELIA